MRFLGRFFIALGAVAVAAMTFIIVITADGVRAQISRTIRIVVPYAPGGTADIVARLLADQAGRAGGPAMIVENRPGAGGAVGTETVARATADGTTLLVGNSGSIRNGVETRKLNYDPLRNFAPLCNLVSAPTVIAVNSAAPYRTLAQMLDDARARPGQITMASIGPGSSFQLGFEMLKRAAKVDITFVPYPGNAPALNAVLGQQVTSMFATLSNVSEYLKAGSLRALAVGNRARAQPLPDVPTVAEGGYGDFDIDAWFGAFAPAATPEPAINEVEHLFTTALDDAAVKEKLSAQGLFPTVACGNDFAAYLRKQNDTYSRIITEANIKAE